MVQPKTKPAGMEPLPTNSIPIPGHVVPTGWSHWTPTETRQNPDEPIGTRLVLASPRAVAGARGRVEGVEQRVWPLTGPCWGLEPLGHPTSDRHYYYIGLCG